MRCQAHSTAQNHTWFTWKMLTSPGVESHTQWHARINTPLNRTFNVILTFIRLSANNSAWVGVVGCAINRRYASLVLSEGPNRSSTRPSSRLRVAVINSRSSVRDVRPCILTNQAGVAVYSLCNHKCSSMASGMWFSFDATAFLKASPFPIGEFGGWGGFRGGMSWWQLEMHLI